MGVFAELKPTSSNSCVDLLLVFARGSGQNQDHILANDPFNPDFAGLEPESYSFFNWFKQHLTNEYPHVDYKAVSVHDFPGKYDPVGYKAAPVGFPGQIPNDLNAEVSWIPGDYRDSVHHGVVETVGYLNDQLDLCPSQSIIVGGYSQGAQVMGDAIAQLTPQNRARILGIGLFGDPKFVASTDSALNPFDKAVSYPWRRGDATNKDSGMLDPRAPYVPKDIEKRTASYCMRTDPICSGWTGARKHFTSTHGNYGDTPMFNTVNELMQWAAPKLAQTERAQGGFDTTNNDSTTPQADMKERDIMLLLNDDSMGKALGTFRYDTDIVMSSIAGQFPNTQYAIKGFGEGQDGATDLPRVNNLMSFQPYYGYNVNQPMFTTSNLYRAIANRYPFGQPYTGGGDFADPHGLAIERSALSSGWRPEAEKHIVLVTDRPPKLNYSYNICNATVRSWLQIPNTDGYSACYSNMGFDIWPSLLHPEVCETVYKAITQTDCKNPITKPGYSQMVNRTLEDGITAAQSQHISVDVVIPYKVTDPYDPSSITKMQADLEYLAKSTGGAFIYYNQRDQFDRATYSDMMYQVFGHKPKDLVVAYKEAMDSLDEFNKGHVLGASTDRPVILDASSSNTSFVSYKWDFNSDGSWDDTSPGPVIEHTFTAPQTGFVRFAGVDADGGIAAESKLAVNITPGDPLQVPAAPSVPEVTATTQIDGAITLNWLPGDGGTLVIIDPISRLPVVSVPTSAGTVTLRPVQPYDSLEVRAVNDSASSDPKIITIPPAPAPLVVIGDPIPYEQTQVIVEPPPSLLPIEQAPPLVVVDTVIPEQPAIVVDDLPQQPVVTVLGLPIVPAPLIVVDYVPPIGPDQTNETAGDVTLQVVGVTPIQNNPGDVVYQTPPETEPNQATTNDKFTQGQGESNPWGQLTTAQHIEQPAQATSPVTAQVVQARQGIQEPAIQPEPQVAGTSTGSLKTPSSATLPLVIRPRSLHQPTKPHWIIIVIILAGVVLLIPQMRRLRV